MRGFIVLTLFFSVNVFAEAELENKLKALEEAREEELYKWRTIHKFNNKLPHDDYTKFYQETWEKYLKEELGAYQEACKTNKNHCLTTPQIELKKSQVNVVTGLMARKNEWAKKGLSAEEQEKKETEFKREAEIDQCVTHKVGCEKLSTNDQKVVTERGDRKPAVTTPETEVKAEVEVVPEVKAEETPKEVKSGSESSGDKTTLGLDQVAQILEEKLQEELRSLEVEFEKGHPDFKNKEMTEEVKSFLQAQEALRHEKVIEIFKDLCARFPKSPEVCLSEEQIKKLKDESSSTQCLVERKFKHKKDAELLSKLEDSHQKDWEGLPEPRSCEALFKKEQEVKVETKPEENVVEENEDEKNPRNYKAETCRWVTDLPRKIVNGPGCSSKGRSLICTGYVVCEQKEGGGKFIRMSTCGADKCGGSDEDAVRCTKDQRYFSQKPSGETKLFMTPRVKKILSGSSEQ